MCFYLSTCFFQACKMSCQSSCVGVLWRQPSAMWRVTQRASCSAAKTTAGAGARPDSQNATVPSPTSRSWKRTWTRANRPGAGSTKSSWNQVNSIECYRRATGDEEVLKKVFLSAQNETRQNKNEKKNCGGKKLTAVLLFEPMTQHSKRGGVAKSHGVRLHARLHWAVLAIQSSCPIGLLSRYTCNWEDRIIDRNVCAPPQHSRASDSIYTLQPVMEAQYVKKREMKRVTLWRKGERSTHSTVQYSHWVDGQKVCVSVMQPVQQPTLCRAYDMFMRFVSCQYTVVQWHQTCHQDWNCSCWSSCLVVISS